MDIHYDKDGGAIYSTSHDIIISSSTFSKCATQGTGGCLFLTNFKHLNITDSSFQEISAEKVAAGYFDGTDANILDTNISSARAILKNSGFQLNAQANVQRVCFERNRDTPTVGAVEVTKISSFRFVRFLDLWVTKCPACIYSSANQINLESCQFSRLKPESIGRSIASTGKVILLSCIFEKDNHFEISASSIQEAPVNSDDDKATRIVLFYLLGVVPFFILYAVLRMFCPLCRAKRTFRRKP